MANITREALLALLAEMEEAETEEADTLIGTGTHFASLGFVAVGNGNDPGEGSVINVPTKAGKLSRVQTVQKINVAPFAGNFGDWAYTYKRMKRGE